MTTRAEWEEAVQLNDLGRELADRREYDEAARYYQRAIDLCDAYEPAWFNLGLLYKLRGQWAESARCNERAAALEGGPAAPVWWNLGIAATALRDWPTARRAWTAFGLDIPAGEGEVRLELGSVPIRVGGPDAPEVVWCTRIDPARGVIENVPFPATGRRWRDVVLHDGSPNGQRTVRDVVVPVFDELGRWAPSEIPTSLVTVRVAAEADAVELTRIFEEAGWAAEDWTRDVRLLCARCSEGQPFDRDEHPHDGAELVNDRRFGLAGPPELARDLVQHWARQGDGRQASDVVTPAR
jgi:hypothetical protein